MGDGTIHTYSFPDRSLDRVAAVSNSPEFGKAPATDSIALAAMAVREFLGCRRGSPPPALELADRLPALSALSAAFAARFFSLPALPVSAERVRDFLAGPPLEPSLASPMPIRG